MTGIQWSWKPSAHRVRNQHKPVTHAVVIHPEMDRLHKDRVKILQVRKGNVHHLHIAYRWSMVREVKGKV